MRLAIMQPYLLPYLGYFQLVSAADRFVIYDKVQYTKRGWINRNRFLVNNAPSTFTLPLCKDSDYLDIKDRVIADTFVPTAVLNQFSGAYSKAPFFAQTFELLERIFKSEERNLFKFLHHSLLLTLEHINISSKLVVASQVPASHDERGQQRVLSICKAMGASTYINPVGGTHLYSKKDFIDQGVNLRFLRPVTPEYQQFAMPFVSHLSIVDVLMFNSISETQAMVQLGSEDA